MMDVGGWLKPYVTQHPETNSHTLQPEIFHDGLYHDCDPDITELAKYILSNEPGRVFNAWIVPVMMRQWLFAGPTSEIVKIEQDVVEGGEVFDTGKRKERE